MPSKTQLIPHSVSMAYGSMLKLTKIALMYVVKVSQAAAYEKLTNLLLADFSKVRNKYET